MYIAENLKNLRKGRGWTQEEMAEMCQVSPQTISKWERGDNFPDITMLPALANLFETTLDALVGMERINDTQARENLMEVGRKNLVEGDFSAAITVFEGAVKNFPMDAEFVAHLAFALAFEGKNDDLNRAIHLCERLLNGSLNEKIRHTAQAALCLIYFKAGDEKMATAAAANLPHIRESREYILAELAKNPNTAAIDAYLRFIVLGNRGKDDLVDRGEQNIIMVEIGNGIIDASKEIMEKIRALRNENLGFRALPQIRLRDNANFEPLQVRMRHYADYVLEETFENPQTAMEKIILALEKIAEIG